MQEGKEPVLSILVRRSLFGDQDCVVEVPRRRRRRIFPHGLWRKGHGDQQDEIAHVYCRPSHDMSALVSFAGQYSDGDHCEVIYSHSKL